MKIGEILRQLADAIEADDSSDGSDLGLVNASGIVPNASIGPLQQELELLKKSTGVENDVDHFAANDPDELARMQQMAGITPAAAAPVINQTIVINTGSGQEAPSVETTPIEAVTEITEEPEVAKPIKKMSYKDNYSNVSENDDCIIDVGDAYDRLKEEFEAQNGNKGKK